MNIPIRQKIDTLLVALTNEQSDHSMQEIEVLLVETITYMMDKCFDPNIPIEKINGMGILSTCKYDFIKRENNDE